MVVVLSMGIGLFAPPFGVGYYAACGVSRIHPNAGMRPVVGYMAALVIGTALVAVIPWFSTGFLEQVARHPPAASFPMLYEIATLSCPVLSVRELSSRASRWLAGQPKGGSLLGLWRAEAGALGRLLILRGFETAAEQDAERKRLLMSSSPFDGGDILTGLSVESYAPFPFLPPVTPRRFGDLYEFRTYQLAPGTLDRVTRGWEAAMEPAREYTSHMIVNMHALDGPLRITHIWGFPSFETRAGVRARASAAKAWPPNDVPEHIIDASSILALPEAGSPLC